MDRARQILLASPSLAVDQNVDRRVGEANDLVRDLGHQRIVAVQMLDRPPGFNREAARRRGPLRDDRMGEERLAVPGGDHPFFGRSRPGQQREVISIAIEKRLEALTDDRLGRTPINPPVCREKPLRPMGHAGNPSIGGNGQGAFGIDVEKVRRMAETDDPIRTK